MSDVTRILRQIETGDSSAAEKLLPLVYDELRRLAAAKLSSEIPGQTLQATALVHEAYLRLVKSSQVPEDASANTWEGRGHFFAAAAEAMRRILVENARRKNRVKHGGDFERIDLEHLPVLEPRMHEDLIALDEALKRLAAVDALAVQLVHLRYFVGLSMNEAAKMIGLSTRSAERIWTFARAWLRRELADSPEGDRNS